MNIEKNGKTYVLTEQENKWRVTTNHYEPIKVNYDFPKKDFSSVEEVKAFITKDDLF